MRQLQSGKLQLVFDSVRLIDTWSRVSGTSIIRDDGNDDDSDDHNNDVQGVFE